MKVVAGTENSLSANWMEQKHRTDRLQFAASMVWILARHSFVVGMRAIKATRGRYLADTDSYEFRPQRAVCMGMVVGLIGLYCAQITSYSIWIDTVFSVWVILVALNWLC